MFFFGYIAKICILQALVLILAIGLGKKNKKKMQFLVIFDLRFKDVICIILTCFLFFWFSWSQEITFYILIMAVAHSCEHEKKWKFWNFSNIQKKSKFSFFLLSTAIKSYFLTLGKPNKQTKSQNNAYNILEMKLKND